MQTKTREEYDVLVVGSGASGGWAAKRMTEAGLNVALVDAGRPLTDADYSEHKQAFELRYRGRAPGVVAKTRPRQRDCYACTEYNYDWFANDLEEPYTTPADKPFSWQGRMRIIGGRTNVWGRQSYRLSQQDLKGKTFDGQGADWPLNYEDLVPYYELVEDYVGISGQAENVPELPDSKFLPPMELTCAEAKVRRSIKDKFGRTLTIGRTANLTKPIHGRAACHYCGPCERGCATHSYFNSAFTTVADAFKTGKCTHIPNAMVYRVLMDPATHKARGLMYIDRNTRAVREVKGKTVVLCAQAMESARILLNSSTEQDPNGLANSSGVLGHYLMDHLWVAGGASGDFPDIPGDPSLGQARRPNGMYVIRFRNPMKGERHKDFVRGYGFQGGGAVQVDFAAPGFGEEYKQKLKSGLSIRALRGLRRVSAVLRESRGDRQERGRRVRHPGAADQHGVGRQREEDDPRHGGLGGGDAGGVGREERPAVSLPGSRAGLRHSRSGRGADGGRSEDVGAEPVPAGPRRQEPVRDGRRVLPVVRVPEPDADDHGAGRALVRLPDAGDEARQPVVAAR